MSNDPTTDPWESELSRGLGEHARGLDEAPFSLDQVKGRASRIRRNRRLAAAGSVLAVAAVLVPVGVIAGPGLDGRTDRDIPPASQRSETVTPSEAVEAGGTGLGIDYVVGRDWVRADAPVVRLPDTYSSALLLGDLLVGSRNDDDTGIDELDLVDEDGEITDTVRGVVAGPVANDDGTAMAYVTASGEMVVQTPDDRRTVARELTGSAQPVALIGDCDADDADCRLYFEPGDGKSPTQLLAADGSVADAVTADPTPIGLTDATGDVVATQLTFEDGGACFALYDPATGDYTWQTCDYSLLDLDASGTHVAVSYPYLDGPGNGWIAILDEDHREVARLGPEDGVVQAQVWGSDGSLYVTRLDRPTDWSIWRLDVDGTSQRVVAGGKGTEETPHYLLLG